MSFLLFFSLPLIFEFRETGGLSSLVQAKGAVLDIPVCASLNPSLIFQTKKSGFNLTFTYPYGLRELKYLKGDLVMNKLGLGLGLSSLARPGYGEYIFSLGKGFPLLKSFSLGILLNLYYFSISGYEGDFFFSLNPSLSFSHDAFLLSLILLNANQPKSLYGEELPLTVLFGVNFSPLNGTDFYFDYQRAFNGRAEAEEKMRGGCRLRHKSLFLGTGFETEPALFVIGFGISLARFEVSYAVKIHSRLKESYVINFGMRFSN